MAQVPTSAIFTDETVTYFGTGTASDPSPTGGTGYCGLVPINSSYFAAVQPEFMTKYPGCVYGVAVQVIDTCPGCTKSSDNGSLSISELAMGNMLGGGESLAANKGVLQHVTWEAITCPSTWGPISNIVTAGGGGSASTVSPSASSGSGGASTTVNGNTNDTGPIIGGVAAGIFLLGVVAFTLWLKARQKRQEQESTDMMIINRYGASSSQGQRSFLRNSARTATSPSTGVPSVNAGTSVNGMISPHAGFLVVPGASGSFPVAAPQQFQQQFQQPVAASSPAQQYAPVVGNSYGPEQRYSAHVSQDRLLPAAGNDAGDFSAEWAEYFQRNPQEYERYYGVPLAK
ncbi:hypothetical protein HDU84_005767 [Entophlyctis sp. JEL0112]|nr:hypothetical protein HDU84_005767 [Entophlyctis sp. JEL0112]